jgi:ATP-dependent DNA helicase RecQ
VGHFGEVADPCGDACDRCSGEDVLEAAPAVHAGRVSRRKRRSDRGARGARSRGGGEEAAPRRPPEPDGDEEAGDGGPLFERLRAWRSQQARTRGVPAYVVFPDRTLLEIARRSPGDLDELAEVKGVGPRKLAEFGEELLQLVRAEAG